MKNLSNKFFIALTIWILIIGSAEAQVCGDNTTDTGE